MLLTRLKDPFVHIRLSQSQPQLNTRMPTEREQEIIDKLYKQGHFKQDLSHARLPFLDQIEPCYFCNRVRTVCIYLLALYGLYSLVTAVI